MTRSLRFPRPIVTLPMALPIIAAAVLASLAVPAHAAQLVMMNNTVDPLVLYVENKRACAAAPGKDCAVQVDPGSHHIRVTTPNGTSTYDVLTVPANGLIWTVNYYQPKSNGPGEKPAK